MKTTVVIVDDHILIAKALENIINNFADFEVLYVCENGKRLQKSIIKNDQKPEIILLDISMPEMDGFETALWLQQDFPDIKTMALSMQGDDNSVIKMVKNGAKGYLLKNTHPADLEKALKRMQEDGFYYPEWASKIIFSNFKNKEENPEIKFSEREKEFLKFVVSEMSYKEIADKMCCSPRTVESYRDQLCEKLDLKSRVGLAVFALKNGFAES
ncbi:two-component system response regulator [Chryseobacterium sp. Leaf180]|uniref:response regulator transcription factor n=1 Tax=Chryseobacterium sp. Leaf180 TaxID=1736289 RepID=UPI0006F72354|nr:response regulator transcription factor [Chryseobacterium sp. Leaf180]KQR93780.1 two-component system response regulator [Chryseobacterium sp. Leaf180]